MWEFRWYESDDGQRRRKTTFIGTRRKYPSESAARKAPEVQAVLFRINGGHPKADGAVPTVGAIVTRYKQEELPERYSTRAMYLSLFNNHVLPRWSDVLVCEIEPLEVEKWLQGLTLAPKTRKHIRGVMHLLFQCAYRWQWLNANPITTVRVKGGSKRISTRRVFTPDEYYAILSQMKEPHRTMVLIAGCLGLRVCEISALQWGDFDFANSTVLVQRSIVHGHVGDVKTEYSRDHVPLDSRLAEAILRHRECCYPTPEGWLFANPKTSRPYRSDQIQKKQLKKAAERAGLGVGIGWHTFRHTYRAWLDDTGAPMTVQQELMRHADITTTMNVYGKAMAATKRQANSKVVSMAIRSAEAAKESVMGVTGGLSETAKAV
jgi:integrase